MEVTVAIIGALATVAAAVLPPLIQHRPSAPASFVNPPRWASLFFGAASAVLFALISLLAFAANSDTEVSALAFIEMLTLAAVAAVLSGFIGYRRKTMAVSVISYTVAVLGVMMLIHVLVSPHQTRGGAHNSLEFTPTMSYMLVLFLLTGASALSFILILADSHRQVGQREYTQAPPSVQDSNTSTANTGVAPDGQGRR